MSRTTQFCTVIAALFPIFASCYNIISKPSHRCVGDSLSARQMATTEQDPQSKAINEGNMTVLEQFSLAGHVAVVTGAGKGIGRGIALALAEAGAAVVLGARTKVDLQETAHHVEAAGSRALILPGDVNQKAYLDQLAEIAVTGFGQLTIWVNNAGGLPDATPRRS